MCQAYTRIPVGIVHLSRVFRVYVSRFRGRIGSVAVQVVPAADL